MNRNPIKVLLVEDSADDAEILLFELANAAYQVEYERVETAEEMHLALTRQPWDMVISDYSMPRFSGFAALDLLQSMGIDTPFLMVSGAIGEERAVEIMRRGANDYVMKDNLKRLVPAIQRELREAEERQARKRAEEQVRNLSRALEQSASLVMITDTTGVIEFVNPAFIHVTGYNSDEIVGKHSRLLQSGEPQQAIYEQLWSTILTGETWRGELQNKKKSGESYWVEIVISAIKDPTGQITQFLAVQEDISERKRLETELQRYTLQLEKMVEERTTEVRHAKEQIEIILDNTHDGVALAEADGTIQTSNPAFLAMFGNHVTQIREHILRALLSHEQRPIVASAFDKALWNHELQRLEAQIISEDGKIKDLDLALIPVQLADQTEQSGILVSAHEITHLKEIERFKARFVADAVHDLATPIAGLSTRVYLLKQVPSKLDVHVRALENQVGHLSDLLSDLRTLSQLDRRQLALGFERCSINQLALRVFDTYEPVALDREQTLILKTEPALPELLLDSRQIERVLVNLVSNAINYTSRGKTIKMLTALEDSYTIFSITDEGIGISAEELPHVFERFYRTDRARQTQSSGTGLGLAIVKEVIELHGGTVTVSSQPGQGSTFTVRLPIR